MANRAIALLVVALFATAHSQLLGGGGLGSILSGVPVVGGIAGGLLPGLGLGNLGGLPLVGPLLGGCPAGETQVTAKDCDTLDLSLTCDKSCNSTAICINVCTGLLQQLNGLVGPLLSEVTGPLTGVVGTAAGLAGTATGALSSATGAAGALTAPATGAAGALASGPLGLVSPLLGVIGGLINTCVCQSGLYRNAAGVCVDVNLCLAGNAAVGATGGLGALGLPLGGL